MNISSKYFFSIVFVLFFLLINTSHVFATGVASVIRGDSATITWNIANSITPGCSPSTVYPDLRSSTPGNIDTVWYDWVNTNTSSNSGSKSLGPVKSAPGIYRFSCTNYASTPNPTDYTDLIVRPEEPTFSATCNQQVNGTYNIALTWNAVTGGTNYPVRIAGPSAATNVGVVTSTNGAVITSSVGGGAVGDAAPTGTSYTFTGVPTAGTYTYWGNSWSSAVSSASPLPADAFSEYTPRAVTCVANQTPNAPTIGGPTTGTAGISYNYTFTATDPDSNTIKYEIDWDNNSTVDQTLPAIGYDPSGTTETQANTWASAGAKTFQARTVDSGGATSAWTTYTVTISPSTCNLPWGGTIANGATVTAYNTTAATSPATCGSETRTCTNGTLSGSFTNQNCTTNYTVTATAGSGGTIAPAGAIVVASGASQTFTIATSTGYSVSTITVDGSAVSNALSTYTFSNVTADHTITIAFTAMPDLVASAITPTTLVATQTGIFYANITNQGLASLSAASFVNLFQVASSSNGGGNIYDFSTFVLRNSPVMAPGSSKQILASYNFPTAGTYSIRACADKNSAGGTGTKAESNEDNNCGPWTDIVVTAAPPIFVAVSAPSPVTFQEGGASLVLSYNPTASVGTDSCALYNYNGTSQLTATSSGLVGPQTVTVPNASLLTAAGSPYGYNITCNSDMSPSVQYTASVIVNVTAAAINGACSPNHFTCTAGTSASNVTNSGSYSWNCNGLNGGTNATCSETPTVSVNVTTPINIDQGSAASVAYTVTPSTGTASCALYNWDSSVNLSGTSTGLTGANTFSIPSANTLAASASPYGYNVKCLLTATPAVGASSGSVSLYVNGCTLNGTTIANGASITAYDTTYANMCSTVWTNVNTTGHSETRTCSGTVLSDPSGTGNFTNTTCTSVTMSVSAGTPVNSARGSTANISYTVTPSTGTAACALYDYANSPVTATTTGITSGAHTIAVPSSSTFAVGSYGYSVKCSSDLAPSVGATSGNLTLNVTGTNCALGDGTVVVDGTSITAYDISSGSCSLHNEVRSCSGGVLSDPSGSGTFEIGSCVETLPDLTADNVSTSVSAYVGQVLTIATSIWNNGAGDTTATFYALYQLANDNLGTGATDIASTTVAAITGHGGMAVTSISYTFQSPGTYYLRICADKNSAGDTGVISESNENNNCSPSWVAITINPVPLPDLSVTNFTPTSATAGVNKTFTETTANISSASVASNIKTFVQVASSSNGGGTIYDLAWFSAGPITANGTRTGNQIFKFGSIGTYSMRACTNKTDRNTFGPIVESDYTNNCGAWTDITVTDGSCLLDGATIANGVATSTYNARATALPDTCTLNGHKVTRTCTNGVMSGDPTYLYLTCTTQGPNLTAGAVSPITATVGNLTTFSSTISNIGATTTPAGFNNFIQVASTSDGSGTSYSLAYTAMGILTAGATGITSQTYTFTSAGTYSMRACADKNNAASAGTIAEANGLGTAENDNCSAWTPITVSAATCGNGATNPPTCSTNNIVASAGANGTITPTGTTAVPYGTSQVYTITPSSGYSLATLTVDGVVVANAATYTFSNVTAAHTISATFSFNPQPDLTAGAISPITATAGTQSTFSSTITNAGGLTTGAAFNNFIQISTLPNGGGTVTDLASVNMSTLAAGGTAVTSQSYTFPAAGTYSMRACADKSSSGNSGTITESNAGGTGESNNCGAWTDITVSAAPVPVVQTATVTGNNTPSGNITFSCGNSTGWQVTNSDTGVTIMSGTYPPTVDPTTVAVSVSGNYQVKCTNGGATDQTTLLYDSTPAVSDSVSLIVNQTSIRSGSSTSLTWSVANPVVACVLTASPVCTGGACTSPRDDARIAAASALTTTLSSGSTDINDPYGASRLMTTAIRTKVSGTKALGKKTVSLQYTTDFQLNCGGTATQKVRVNVTNDNEG